MALFFNNRRDMGNISMSPSMYPGDIVQDERFGVDPMTQEAVDQYAALPAPIMEGRKGGGFGEVLKALAGGVLDGVATHYGAEPGYSGARTQRDKLMAEMQARQAEEAQWRARKEWEWQNAPKESPKPPAMIRNLDEWEKLPPERKRALAEMQATLYPQFATGADKMPYQTNTPPPVFTDDDWNSGQPLGGGVSNGTGGFPY